MDTPVSSSDHTGSTIPIGQSPLTNGLCWLTWGILTFPFLGSLFLFWGLRLEYIDRILVLLASIAISWNLPRPTVPIRQAPWLGSGLILIGLLTYPLTVFVLTQVGIRVILLWWQLLALQCMAIGILAYDGGYFRVKPFLFPLVFLCFALPIPQRILTLFQNDLQSLTTSCGAAALSAFGFDVQRDGVILTLPGGQLEVAEACSGIRSLTALTALAALVAYFNGLSLWRGLIVLSLSIPLVLITNFVRVILSGIIQEWFGNEYIQGSWHEGLGFVMVLVGLVAIVKIVDQFKPSVVEDQVDKTLSYRKPSMLLPTSVLGFGVLSTLAALIWGLSIKVDRVESAPIQEIPLELNDWKGKELEIPDLVTGMMAQDDGVYRIYTNKLGQEVHVWIFYWSVTSSMRGYHHPDNCWPSRGYELIDKSSIDVQFADSAPIALTARSFANGTKKHFVVYWTQDGSRIWAKEDEAKLLGNDRTFWQGPLWLEQSLKLNTENAAAGRLMVVLATDSVSNLSQRETTELAELLGSELYRCCPWGKPSRVN